MKKTLLGLFILIGSIFNSIGLLAQQVSLYNGSGKAVVYIDYGNENTIFTWSGEAIAYLTRQNSEELVFDFEGSFLGWYENGAVYNTNGDIVWARKERLNFVPELEDVKNVQSLVPIKAPREVVPVKPIFSNNFSSGFSSKPNRQRFRTSTTEYQDFMYKPNLELMKMVAQARSESIYYYYKMLAKYNEELEKLIKYSKQRGHYQFMAAFQKNKEYYDKNTDYSSFGYVKALVKKYLQFLNDKKSGKQAEIEYLNSITYTEEFDPRESPKSSSASSASLGSLGPMALVLALPVFISEGVSISPILSIPHGRGNIADKYLHLDKVNYGFNIMSKMPFLKHSEAELGLSFISDSGHTQFGLHLAYLYKIFSNSKLFNPYLGLGVSYDNINKGSYGGFIGSEINLKRNFAFNVRYEYTNKTQQLSAGIIIRFKALYKSF